MPCFTPSSSSSRPLPPAQAEEQPTGKTIRIQVDDEVLKVLIDNDFQLCVAFEVNGIYNVIARMIDPSTSMHIHWERTYVMQATNEKFRFGRVINGAGGLPLPIRPLQKYIISNWKTQTVVEDPTITRGRFGFQNDIMAAPVIYMAIGEGDPSPIYTTKILPPKNDSEYLCRAKVALWFNSKADFRPYSIFDFQTVKRRANEFDLTHSDEIDVLYTAEGDWRQSSTNVKGTRNTATITDGFHFELRQQRTY